MHEIWQILGAQPETVRVQEIARILEICLLNGWANTTRTIAGVNIDFLLIKHNTTFAICGFFTSKPKFFRYNITIELHLGQSHVIIRA